MAEETAERGENAYDWQSLMFLYNAAIKEVRTKLDIMNDEFNTFTSTIQLNISNPALKRRTALQKN